MRGRYLLLALLIAAPAYAQSATSDSASAGREWPTSLQLTQWIGAMGRDGLILSLHHDGTFSLLSMPFVKKVDGYKARADEARMAHGRWWVEHDNQLCLAMYREHSSSGDPLCFGAEVDGAALHWGEMDLRKQDYDRSPEDMRQLERDARLATSPQP